MIKNRETHGKTVRVGRSVGSKVNFIEFISSRAVKSCEIYMK